MAVSRGVLGFKPPEIRPPLIVKKLPSEVTENVRPWFQLPSMRLAPLSLDRIYCQVKNMQNSLQNQDLRTCTLDF